MKQLVRGKHRHLLEDERVKRWYDNLYGGSKITADVYMRRLGLICALRGTSPPELASRGRKDQEWLCNFLMDLVGPDPLGVVRVLQDSDKNGLASHMG